MRPVPHSEKLPAQKPPENLTFSYDKSDADEDHGQQEGDNVVDCDQAFEVGCSPSELHLLTPCL